MTGRRALQLALFGAIVLGIVALFWLRPKVEPVVPRRLSLTKSAPGASAPASTSVPAPAPSAPVEDRDPASGGESRLADDLNAPGGTIQRDLAILEELFATWQTNFPRTGNPVGENAEITASLAGDNPVKFAFIPRRHRAINAAGELCDRWGTPFRFHQLSGTQMEIRSAGPDRKFGTADDAHLAPPQ
jgi:hypothetical protein